MKIFNKKSRERYYVSYKDDLTNKVGLKDKESDLVLIDATMQNGFVSLLPSKRNSKLDLPAVVTYTKYNNDSIIIRGVIEIKGANDYDEISLPDTYNFIDGFEKGLARVSKVINGTTKWGIIGLEMSGDKPIAKEIVEPKYDDIVDFYDEPKWFVKVSINDTTSDLSLDDLREKLTHQRKPIIAISEDTIKEFKNSNKHLESKEFTANSITEVSNIVSKELPPQISGRGSKINLLVKFIINKKESNLMDDLSIFSSSMAFNDVIGELIWGVDIDNKQDAPYLIELTTGWNDMEVEFSEDGQQVKLKGVDYEATAFVTNDGIRYSVGHAKGKRYDFGVIDHTSKKVILPFVFNHISLGINTLPAIASVNFHGRWYVLHLQNDDFNIDQIEYESIVDSSKYTLIDGFDNGLARVRIEKLWGIINTEGKEVVPVIYENIWNFYGKNRNNTTAERNGDIEQIWFNNLYTKDTLQNAPGSVVSTLQNYYMPKLNSVSMNNFKRFGDNVEILFRDINFFVGPNNAGKSTSIKALILLSYNLYNLHFNYNYGHEEITIPFDFAPQEYPNLNTSSYLHSVNKNRKDEIINLAMSLGHCDFDAKINKASNIERLSIFSHNADLGIDISDNSVKLYSNNITSIEYQIKDNRDINSLQRGTDLINVLIDGFSKFTSLSSPELLDKIDVFNTDIQNSINALRVIKHIPIYSASRAAILNRYDNNDLSAIAATSYLELTEVQKRNAREFMLKWMDIDHFIIGNDFRITTIKNRNSLLTVEILVENGEWCDLCDLGTGSNHLFVLLLSLACLLVKYVSPSIRPIIAIEEPEMNLHPKFQSMLTQLFKEANDFVRKKANIYKELLGLSDEVIENFGFQFVIETHSEYVIRKSQILVAEFARDNKIFDEKELKEILPIQIYYFPPEINESPYIMNFRTNGTFETTFGKGGFFDEAGNSHLRLIKIAKDSRNV